MRKMKLRIGNAFGVVRPRVSPDPVQAAELERRVRELNYTPENGFHRDRVQQRNERKS
jgi:hypothetical protein